MNSPKNTYTVRLLDGVEITSQTEETLLESLEQAEIPVLFHCREGFCGACRCKLEQGDVHYVTDPLAFIDDDEILLCCCQARSDLKLTITN